MTEETKKAIDDVAVIIVGVSALVACGAAILSLMAFYPLILVGLLVVAAVASVVWLAARARNGAL